MSVDEIEAAIKTLPKEELARFNQWYQEFLEEQWDEQIRQDIKAGKIDFQIAEATTAAKEGKLHPFPNLASSAPYFSRRKLRPEFKKMMEEGKLSQRPGDRDITDLISEDRD